MKKFTYDHADFSQYKREQAEGWDEVRAAIMAMPPLPLGDDLTIRVVPPFGALAARFLVGDKVSTNTISVYLDTTERAGHFAGNVYWEMYPAAHGDVDRFDLEDVAGLFASIRESLAGKQTV